MTSYLHFSLDQTTKGRARDPRPSGQTAQSSPRRESRRAPAGSDIRRAVIEATEEVKWFKQYYKAKFSFYDSD